MIDDTSIETVESWILNKTQAWRSHYETNYADKHEEYNRTWRGIWADEDKTRQSERSRLISPATQQAVESSVAEIEEATFGRGRWFDIEDDDTDNGDIVSLREQLYADSKKTKTRKAVAECLMNAAVYGTGIGEIVIETIKESAPARQPIMDGALEAVGVTIQERTVCRLRPIMPKNFLIDPVATSIEEAIGVAIEEYVPEHTVELLQEKGVYDKDARIVDSTPADLEITPDRELTSVYTEGKVKLLKYYGLVPRHLLNPVGEDEEVVQLTESEDDSYYVEAVVVIANDGVLLKSEENPYMMQDRPIVAFPWDVVPSQFWGRGICEKAYNSQKALDAELRARTDALALTVSPMMAMDATRLPRGARPEVRAGKTLLTNGAPQEIIMPFKFGSVDQITFAQAAQLERMVQSATGAVDSAGIAGNINGEATAAGISMSLGAIIKRQKRTLINFQESFVIPYITKVAHRYMQYEPETYATQDYTFNASSSLGIVAREYEVSQLVQLLQTMERGSPEYLAILSSTVDNMNLSNREDIMKVLQESAQPSEEETAAAQAAQQAAQAFQESQTATLNAQAAESNARAAKYNAETQAIPANFQLDVYEAETKAAADEVDRKFKQRETVGKLLLQENKGKGAMQ